MVLLVGLAVASRIVTGALKVRASGFSVLWVGELLAAVWILLTVALFVPETPIRVRVGTMTPVWTIAFLCAGFILAHMVEGAVVHKVRHLSPDKWNAWERRCERMSAFEKLIGRYPVQ